MTNRKNFAVTLTTLEPFRIGGVNDPLSDVNNPVTTVGGRLVVPGPSLKGILRNAVEHHLINSYWRDGCWPEKELALQPCIPTTRRTLDEDGLVNQNKYRKNACHYPCLKKPCPSEKENEMSHTICPVCYFFGAMGVIGFLRVPFLLASSSGNELYSSRMDRSIGTVVEGTNRPYQLVPNGVQFTGTLEVLIKDTVLGWELGKPRPFPEKQTKGDEWLKDAKRSPDELIKEFVLDRLQAITLLGGYKSKGFGRVKIEVKELKEPQAK